VRTRNLERCRRVNATMPAIRSNTVRAHDDPAPSGGPRRDRNLVRRRGAVDQTCALRFAIRYVPGGCVRSAFDWTMGAQRSDRQSVRTAFARLSPPGDGVAWGVACDNACKRRLAAAPRSWP
jgi:hypothetical protein